MKKAAMKLRAEMSKIKNKKGELNPCKPCKNVNAAEHLGSEEKISIKRSGAPKAVAGYRRARDSPGSEEAVSSEGGQVGGESTAEGERPMGAKKRKLLAKQRGRQEQGCAAFSMREGFKLKAQMRSAVKGLMSILLLRQMPEGEQKSQLL